MPVTLSPNIDSPAEITVTGTVGLRAASDIVDLVDLLAPEAVVVHFDSRAHLNAEAATHLAKYLRRRDVRVDAAPDAHHVRFLLALIGIPTRNVVAVDAVDAGAAWVAA